MVARPLDYGLTNQANRHDDGRRAAPPRSVRVERDVGPSRRGDFKISADFASEKIVDLKLFDEADKPLRNLLEDGGKFHD
jgi:hypothetical protein